MADRLRELEVVKEDKRGELRALLAAASKDKRSLSDEERAAADALTEELDRITATIKFEQKALEYDRTDAIAVDHPAGEAPDKKHPKAWAQGLGGSKNPWGDCSTPRGVDQALGNFLIAVANHARNKVTDARLFPTATASGLNTSVGQEGGFLVRTDFSTALLDKAMEESQLAQRCTTIDVGEGSDGIELPYVDETTRVNGSRWGGVQVYRRAEADTVTASKPKLGLLEIRLEDIMGICYTTDRAMRDAVSLGQLTQRAFASEFSFRVDDEIIRGSGAGQCLGLLNSPALVSVAKETNQAADTFLAENAIKMRARMPPRSRAKAIWAFNQELETQFPRMFIGVKNMAGTENVGGFGVYQQAGNIAGGTFDTMFSRPMIPVEQCAAIGDKGDIFYADLTEYLLIRKGALETAESIHVRFLYGENTFRFTYRINGAPAWKTSLTPYKGSATQSPFITLDAR